MPFNRSWHTVSSSMVLMSFMGLWARCFDWLAPLENLVQTAQHRRSNHGQIIAVFLRDLATLFLNNYYLSNSLQTE